MTELATPRLILRQWRDADREPFAALNADPVTMEFFPTRPDRAASDAMIDRIRDAIATRGWGSWAVEVRETGEFIGFTGLSVPRAELPFSPTVEVGWRLARSAWGHGYATEAAKESLRYAFETLALPEIVSFTTLLNVRSRAVMERIGLRNTDQDFLHPAIPEGHPQRPHCLYRISRNEWFERRG